MIRMLVFFALLLAAALGIAFLVETPGHVVLAYGGFEYKVSLAKGLAVLFGLALILMIIWTVVRLVFRLPGLLSMSNRMRRRARGYTAVSRGLVSVGVGDRRAATRFASEAERLLGREPMTLLLKAQAAQLAGDRQGAEATFTRMLDSAETKVLGLRGLFVEARRNGSDAARMYAEEAFRISPAAPWAGEAVLEYRCADKNWRGALAAVDENASRRLIDRDTAKKQKATLLAAEALDQAATAPDAAFDTAMAALKLNPGHVPVAVLAARRLAARGDYAKASRVVETAWKLGPHPDLAEAHLSVRHGDSSHDRLKRARHLMKLAPTARESKLTVAKAALEAREFSAARQDLEQLILEQPTARACRLMAELEDQETGNAGMVRKWLSRASHAPRDPAWVADGFVSDHWSPISPVTGRIDAFVWTTPPQSLESTVRASIDADRFEVPPAPPVEPVALPEPVSVAEPVATTAEVDSAPVSATATSPGDEAQAPAATRENLAVLSHLPDDPGPRSPTGDGKKGWRFFG